jgi:hypothetical protein
MKYGGELGQAGYDAERDMPEEAAEAAEEACKTQKRTNERQGSCWFPIQRV